MSDSLRLVGFFATGIVKYLHLGGGGGRGVNSNKRSVIG